MHMYFKHTPVYCMLALLVSIIMILSGCQQEEQYLKTKMGFKPVLATTKVTLATTSYIRFASKIEGQQSIDIASLQSGGLHNLHNLHNLHIAEGMQVKQGQALVAVYSPELADNYASTQANLQQTRVTLTTEQLRLSGHQKLYGLNA